MMLGTLIFGGWDIFVFVLFVVCVVGLGIFKSRKEKTGEDYFLAGRGLVWPLIGFSLIAANISTEQFVGMSGNAASYIGLAIASYEWLAAITLIVVAFGFLPYFLRAGIYTMPEFLEYRYTPLARTIMAIATLFVYMLLLGSVTYAGALTIRTLADKMGYTFTLMQGSLVIGVIAMVYVGLGGLKACAWADLLQGSALIVGGAVIMYFAFDKLGAVTEAAKINVTTGAVTMEKLAAHTGVMTRFWHLNSDRMSMFLPSTDSTLPWTALLLGLWIPNFYYWGLNQYITQRTLGASSLSQGQKGITFAAFMKLITPFVIVIPGIIAFNLYAGDMQNESANDNAKVMAKYIKANPGTTLVTIEHNPDNQTIKDWPNKKFMLAIYDNKAELDKIEAKNPRVLPITKSKYDKTEVAPFTIFDTKADKALPNIYPNLVAELNTFNAKVEAEAKKAGQKINKEKFIAYKYDTAMGQLIGNVLPQGVGIIGFVLAALLGAVVSSLAAMLNAASTIFTMDIFKKHIKPDASQTTIVLLGRICVVLFSVIAVALSPQLGNPKIGNSIFTIIQESQGFLSPGILGVFAFGLLVRKAPAITGAIGLIVNIIVYGSLMLFTSNINFLNRMAISFGCVLLVMAIITAVAPAKTPWVLPLKTDLNMRTSRSAKVMGVIVILLAVALYVIFR